MVVRDNINPKFWGAFSWRVLFVYVLAYPKNSPSVSDREYFREYFESLAGVLPCGKCRKNANKFLNKHPIENHLSSRYNLLLWVIALHNKSGKKIRNYDDLREIIEGDDKIEEILSKIERKHPKLR